MDICDPAASDEALVGGFQDGLAKRDITYDSEASYEHERGDPGGFVVRGVGPDVNGCFDDGFEDFFEG